MKQDTGKYRNNIKDQFYTSKETATECIQYLSSYDFKGVWIEPSAGTGVFLDLVPDAIGYDIDPKDERIIKQDFLELELPNNCIIFGNPPFGRQGSLAKKFIKHASQKASVIAFILPLSFTKSSMQKTFPLHFHLIQSIRLSPSSFIVNETPYSVPCVFQIWKRESIPRITPEHIAPVGFKFVKFEEKYDFVIRRVGVNAGKCSLPQNQSRQSHYFIKLTQICDVDTIVKKSQTFEFEQNTTGPKSISKSEATHLLHRFISSSSGS